MARHRMRRGRRVVKVERRAAARARAAVAVAERPEMDAVSIVRIYVRARLTGRGE